ncbi:MAG: MBL fold metallo-hydrolase [Myxococcales bacterium]|nr:MBL fold metallo-hydrolase [Myxococcales bacterium]
MQVRFWGVRGSIAVSGGAFAATGGNTTCLEIAHEGHRVILDGGTGLQRMGADCIATDGPQLDATLLFSHVHWDHIQGVPFFGPAFHPGSTLRLGGAPGLADALQEQMRAPMFPVGLDALQAQLSFVDVEVSEPLIVGPFTIHAETMSHPNGVLVYRVEAGGHSVVFATDVEHGEQLDPRLLDFAEGADLLVHDAQYTDDEYDAHRGWGHSTWQQAVDVAHLAGVGQLALCHHDPGRTDAQVAAIEALANQQHRGTFAAREGGRVAL